jgi:hypothetical protein
LAIDEREVAALSRMNPLIATPRAAKRLVNLYRLVRAGLSDGEVTALVDEDQFWGLATVLAAQVGFPRASSELLTELVRTKDVDMTITARLDEVPSLPAGAHVDGANWGSLKSALRTVCADVAGPAGPQLRVAAVQRWLPHVQRYSFEGALAGSNGDAAPGR